MSRQKLLLRVAKDKARTGSIKMSLKKAAQSQKVTDKVRLKAAWERLESQHKQLKSAAFAAQAKGKIARAQLAKEDTRLNQVHEASRQASASLQEVTRQLEAAVLKKREARGKRISLATKLRLLRSKEAVAKRGITRGRAAYREGVSRWRNWRHSMAQHRAKRLAKRAAAYLARVKALRTRAAKAVQSAQHDKEAAVKSRESLNKALAKQSNAATHPGAAHMHLAKRPSSHTRMSKAAAAAVVKAEE
jgi:hypothetical protein